MNGKRIVIAVASAAFIGSAAYVLGEREVLPVPADLLIPIILVSAAVVLVAVLVRPSSTRAALSLTITDGWRDLARELRRSRRHAHPFALARLEPASAAGDATTARGQSAVAVRRAALTLASQVRAIDRVWTDSESVYLLLPESDRAAAERLISRARQIDPEIRMLSSDRIAVFPDDGVTVGALLDALDAFNPLDVPRSVGEAVATVRERARRLAPKETR
jgi:hypothetical protein